ncbi:MAG TPA: hypothetical protein VLM05_12065 [Mycobacteriales bacterium]|nr:hypothetical protein [Mycobacteriales bacterium]
MTREEPAPDPDDASIPAAPASVPEGTAPPVRSLHGTSETAEPVEGVRLPEPDDPA